MTKIQDAVSYKLVSYMRVLTVCELRTTETILQVFLTLCQNS